MCLNLLSISAFSQTSAALFMLVCGRLLKLSDTHPHTLEKLKKIGAKVVRYARYVMFQMAEVAVPRALFCEILERISRLTLVESTPGTG